MCMYDVLHFYLFVYKARLSRDTVASPALVSTHAQVPLPATGLRPGFEQKKSLTWSATFSAQNL